MLLPAIYADNKGFTLIEVMVAIIIMMVGLLALLQTVNLAIAHNNSNKLRNDAIAYADQAIGTERTRKYSDVIASITPIRHKSALGFVSYSVVNSMSNLTATTHSLATDGIAGSKRLQATVSWHEKGVKKSHSITTTIVETAN
jgi:type IV pilus assembly protein PilV